MKLLADRGFDVSGFTADRMTSAEDVYWFPNMVGPIYPGSAILFRARPFGLDPEFRRTWLPPGTDSIQFQPTKVRCRAQAWTRWRVLAGSGRADRSTRPM